MRPDLVVSAPSAGVNVCEVKNVPLLAQNEEKMQLGTSHPPPPTPVYLGRH